MKKLLALLLVLVMVCCMMTACAGSNENVQSEAPAIQESETPVEEESQAPVEETAKPEPTVKPTDSGAAEEPCDTYVDIVAITPIYGAYEASTSGMSVKPIEYSHAICECLTVDGRVEWLHISVDDYYAVFDADSSLVLSDVAQNVGMVALPEVMRIGGVTVKAEHCGTGLADAIGRDAVVSFKSAEVQSDLEVSETVYTASTPAMTCVYIEIVSIVPAYTMSKGLSMTTSDVICQAGASDGTEIWVAMSVEDYNAHIDPSADLAFSFSASFEEMTYETPLVIHGICVEADSVATDLASSIGCDTVINFRTVD